MRTYLRIFIYTLVLLIFAGAVGWGIYRLLGMDRLAIQIWVGGSIASLVLDLYMTLTSDLSIKMKVVCILLMPTNLIAFAICASIIVGLAATVYLIFVFFSQLTQFP